MGTNVFVNLSNNDNFIYLFIDIIYWYNVFLPENSILSKQNEFKIIQMALSHSPHIDRTNNKKVIVYFL